MEVGLYKDGKPLITGMISSIRSADSKVSLTINNRMKNLSASEFVYDYSSPGTVIVGATKGVVNAVDGSTVYLKQAYGTFINPNYRYSPNPPSPGRWDNVNPYYPQYEYVLDNYYNRRTIFFKTLFDIGLVNENSSNGNNFVKFYSGSINSAADNGNGSFYALDSYEFSSGTFINGYGTLVFNRDMPSINPGDWVYFRNPLIYSGVPGNIIKNILTGSNVTIKFSEDDFDNIEFGRGSVVTQHFDMYREIENVRPINVIRDICVDTMSNFYINKESKITWSPLRPRDPVLITGTFNSSNMKNVSYSFIDNTPYDNIEVNFLDGQSIGTSFGSKYNKSLSINSQWIRNREEAMILMYRHIAYRQGGLYRISFNSAGTAADESWLGTQVRISHRAGNLSGRIFEPSVFNEDLISESYTIEAIDTNYFYAKKFGLWEDGEVGTTALGAPAGSTILSGSTTAAWALPPIYPDNSGIITSAINNSDTTIEVSGVAMKTPVVGDYLMFWDYPANGFEILKVLSIPYAGFYDVERGAMTTVATSHANISWITNIGTAPMEQHNSFTNVTRWF